jgi:hypothetical protein
MDSRDIGAFIVAAIMILGPLAAGASRVSATQRGLDLTTPVASTAPATATTTSTPPVTPPQSRP